MRDIGLGFLVTFAIQIFLSSASYAQELGISPDNIVDIIVQASIDKDFVALKGLCGKDSKPIAKFLCNIEQRDEDLREAILSGFALMKKTGNIRLEGDNKSLIPVAVLNKNSNKIHTGTVILIKTNGTWYLTDFLAEGEKTSATEQELETLESIQSIPTEPEVLENSEVE
jgi:hypothetical protein